MDSQASSGHYDFRGRTVVITGATGVLGGEIACALAGCGANVAMLDRNLEPGRALLERMDEAGDCRAALVAADVLDRESLERAARSIVERFGRVDALVNAAGGNWPEASTNAAQSFFDLPADALRWVFDLNLLGTMLPCQVFGRLMAERGEGVILNISSMNAFRPLTRIPAYSAAKAGVSNFTQWLAVHMAQEYSPRIRVNAIAPGFFLTRQNRFLLTDERTGDLTDARPDHPPAHADGALRRAVRPPRRRHLAVVAGLGVRDRRGHADRRWVLGVQRSLSVVVGEGAADRYSRRRRRPAHCGRRAGIAPSRRPARAGPDPGRHAHDADAADVRGARRACSGAAWRRSTTWSPSAPISR